MRKPLPFLPTHPSSSPTHFAHLRSQPRACVCVTSSLHCGAWHNQPRDCAYLHLCTIQSPIQNVEDTESHAGLLTSPSWDRSRLGIRPDSKWIVEPLRSLARPQGRTAEPLPSAVLYSAQSTQSVYEPSPSRFTSEYRSAVAGFLTLMPSQMNAQRNDSAFLRGWVRPLAVPAHCPSRVAGMTLRPELPEHAGRQIGVFE